MSRTVCLITHRKRKTSRHRQTRVNGVDSCLTGAASHSVPGLTTPSTTEGPRRVAPARPAIVSSCMLTRQSRPATPPWAAIGTLHGNCRPPPPHLLESSPDRRVPMPLTPCSNAMAASHRWIRVKPYVLLLHLLKPPGLLHTHAPVLLPPHIVGVIRYAYPPHSFSYGVPLVHQHLHLPQFPYYLLRCLPLPCHLFPLSTTPVYEFITGSVFGGQVSDAHPDGNTRTKTRADGDA